MQPKHVRASRNLGIRLYYCIRLFDIYYITWHGRRIELLSIKQGHEIDTAVLLSGNHLLMIGFCQDVLKWCEEDKIYLSKIIQGNKNTKYQELKQEITSMKKFSFVLVYDGLFIFSSSVKELNVGIRKTRRFYAWRTQCLQVFRFLYFERPKLKVEQHSQRKWLPCHTLTFHLQIRKLQPPGRGLKSLNSNSTKKGIAKCSTPLNNWVTRPHPWFSIARIQNMQCLQTFWC